MQERHLPFSCFLEEIILMNNVKIVKVIGLACSVDLVVVVVVVVVELLLLPCVVLPPSLLLLLSLLLSSSSLLLSLLNSVVQFSVEL